MPEIIIDARQAMISESINVANVGGIAGRQRGSGAEF